MTTAQRRREIWKDSPEILEALDRLEAVEKGMDPDNVPVIDPQTQNPAIYEGTPCPKCGEPFTDHDPDCEDYQDDTEDPPEPEQPNNEPLTREIGPTEEGPEAEDFLFQQATLFESSRP